MVASVGCKGTPNQSTNYHSHKWTHVLRKNRNNEDLSEEELLMIFNQMLTGPKLQRLLPGCSIRAQSFPILTLEPTRR